MSWKDDINRYLDAPYIKTEAAEQAELNRRMVELKSKFWCHICNTSAKKPAEKYVGMNGDYSSIYQTDWSNPGDLTKCKNCDKWTCAKDIHRGICKLCAKRL